MLNCGSETVIIRSWIPSSAWHHFNAKGQNDPEQDKPELLDQVPVMLSTVLGLNMLLEEPCIDLQSVSELVLNDVGATIKILHQVGKEYDLAGEHPRRMGDCIASLDVSTWFRAVSAHTFPCDLEHAEVTEFWEHSRRVAQYAQLVAESIDDVSPEDAYLVGLLHGIRSLPAVLGWPDARPYDTLPDALGVIEGMLPPFVLAGLQGEMDSSHRSSWSSILSAAQELACLRVDDQSTSAQRLQFKRRPRSAKDKDAIES